MLVRAAFRSGNGAQVGEVVLAAVYRMWVRMRITLSGEFWVVGEISDIERDWYFIACVNKGCGKKLQVINDQMYCKSCDQQSPDEIIKYKLVIDVLDDEHDGQLILWDNVCSPLLGITASGLKGKYSEEDCMPNEIKGLIGKTMKFMIVTREDQFKYRGNAAFTVLGVQADEAISNSFKKGEQGSVIRKLAEEKEFNENFGQNKPNPQLDGKEQSNYVVCICVYVIICCSSGIAAMASGKGFVISNGLWVGVIRNGLWAGGIRNGLWAAA
nr:uncharacterized protein LOC109185225 [Ipomoea trifida]